MKKKLKLKRGYVNHKPDEPPKKFKPGFLEMLDKRCAAYSELSNLYDAVIEDLGGEDNLSTIQVCLIEQFTFLAFSLRTIQNEIAQQPRKSSKFMTRFTRLTGSLLSIGKTLGLECKAKKVESLRDRLKGKTG